MSNLSEFIFQSKYSKYNSALGRKETWEESVSRISSMHMEHLVANYPYALDSSEFCKYYTDAINLYEQKRILGSQRALQFGGKPILNKNARLFNCSFTYCDRLEVFKEIEWMLLCGAGVGISVEQKHIDKLPRMVPVLSSYTCEIIIEDSIEGWANAINSLLEYYFVEGSCYPKFDYCAIRKEGAYISGGFVAPGPNGLRNALNKIETILRNVYNTTKKLSALNCSDIIGHMADSVLSGGVRRSAVSILFDPTDDEMCQCKTGNWFYDNPQRARFNMSGVCERDTTSFDTYAKLFDYTKEYGEPGFVWRPKDTIGFNPCFEIGFEPIYNGKTGWQLCNLATINGALINSEEEFYECCIAASTLATIQATYNKFPFLGKTTEDLAKADPLIGISICGIMASPSILLNKDILKRGASIIKQQNEIIASILKINKSSRCTAIKPEGTASILLDTTPGCHGEHSSHYIRRVQVNKAEDIAQYYLKNNPKAVVDSVWSTNHTDYCIMFPVTAKENSVFKYQLLGTRQLDIVKLLFENWILAGAREGTTVENNVSNTVIVPEGEWEKVKQYVYDNRHCLAGISFIPQTADTDYNQPPFTEVLMPDELLDEFGEGVIFASGLIVDAAKVFGDLWTACDVYIGKGEKLYNSEQDIEDFLNEYSFNPEDYEDKTVKEFTEAKNSIYTKWFNLLLKMGYNEDFAEQILDNDIAIPNNEIKKYLDNQMDNVKNLNEKRDIIRRFKKFSDNYFESNDIKMIKALKQVQLYHDWCDITKFNNPIDWKAIKWTKALFNADEMGAAACSGGACEINKI